MSYYVLPKININYILSPCLYNCKDVLSPYISNSLINYSQDNHKILDRQLELECNSSISFKMLTQIIHTYDFLFCCVSGFDSPVSNVSTKHPLYFDIIELYQTLKISEKVPTNNSSKILCFGKKSSSAADAFLFNFEEKVECKILDDLKSTSNASTMYIPQTKWGQYETFEGCGKFNHNCRIIYFEENNKVFSNINTYVLYMMRAIFAMNKYQGKAGCFVLKISTIFYKPIIDLIYIISHMYSKIYIMKPNTSNVLLDDRYIVCKSFVGANTSFISNLHRIYTQLDETKQNVKISSLLENQLSYYFINKVEESNVIIGQQKLDAYTQLINLLKSKNKMDKIELLQKHNVQKCVYWCEKHRIDHNKYTDKLNFFIPLRASSPDTGDIIAADIEELFYTHIEKYYGDSDEELGTTTASNKIEVDDIIDLEKLQSFMKKKLCSESSLVNKLHS